MSILLISYNQELARGNRTETNILSAIKSQQTWARIQTNVYLVKTTLTAIQFRDILLSYVPNSVSVHDVSGSLWAANGLPIEVTQWMQANWRG